MKIAEALILRADYQKRVEQLKQRLLRNARVQEGDETGENPAALIEELERVSGDLTQIIQRINVTNSTTSLEDGLTISDAITVRDVLRLRYAIYRDLAQAASVTQDRFSRSEVRFRSAVNVAEIQRRADDLAREHRDLDARIQSANWQTELRE